MKKRVLILFLVLALTLLSACSLIRINSSKSMVPYWTPFNEAEVKDDGTIVMETMIDDNMFSYVVLQLWEDSPRNYVRDITKSELGKENGIFTLEEETGKYVLVLKANSNKQDAGIEIKANLKKGDSYFYSYNVKSLTEKKVQVQDFVFGLK